MEELAYIGKAKALYTTSDETVYRVHYLDQATALNGQKKDQIKGKGQLNNAITSLIFRYLTAEGVSNHFVKQLDATDQIVKRMTMIPLECVVRNQATGSLSKRLGLPNGKVLPQPVLEFYYKNDALDDPLINESHIELLELLDADQIIEIKEKMQQLNTVLVKLFAAAGMDLIDFKVEYGFDETGDILLADEISPDTCRLWDKETGDSLDKDIYRKDLGALTPVYEEVYHRLKTTIEKMEKENS